MEGQPLCTALEGRRRPPSRLVVLPATRHRSTVLMPRGTDQSPKTSKTIPTRRSLARPPDCPACPRSWSRRSDGTPRRLACRRSCRGVVRAEARPPPRPSRARDRGCSPRSPRCRCGRHSDLLHHVLFDDRGDHMEQVSAGGTAELGGVEPEPDVGLQPKDRLLAFDHVRRPTSRAATVASRGTILLARARWRPRARAA